MVAHVVPDFFKDADTGQESEIPVLRYIGTETAGNDITIPDGVKILDYAFEGNTALTTVPKIPDSVESAHAAFMGCKNITRACKNAKEGEHQGSTDVLTGAGVGAATGATVAGVVGTVAASAATGAGIGAAAGAGVLSVPTAVAGGVVGVVGGVVGAVKASKTDGKGGTWEMPPNLKDASYMFAGCENLTEAYKSASDSLLLARGMYKDNVNIGLDEYATKHGSVSVTDFTDSKLSKEAVQEAYTGTNVAVTEDLKGNYSKSWNDDLEQIEASGMSLEERAEIENLNSKLKAQDVKDGVIETKMAADTDGLAYYAQKRTKTGVTTTMDIKDKNEGVQDTDSSLGNMGTLIDRGIVSLAEFSVLKLITGNALLSAGITFGGQMLGVLPISMKPVLSMIADFVGKDNPVGKALNTLVDKLPDQDSAETVQAASMDDDMSYSARRIKGSVNDYLKVSTGDYTCDITSVMSANGRGVVNDGTILSIGKKGPNSEELKEMSSIAVVTGGALEERAIALAGDDNKLSDEDKKKLSDNVMNLMSGLEAYNKSASKAIDYRYGLGSSKGDAAHAGLGYTMDTMVEPLKATITELNETYDFLSDEDLSKLDAMKISDERVYAKLNGSVVDVMEPEADVQDNLDMADVTIDGVPLDINDSDSSKKKEDKTEVKKLSAKAVQPGDKKPKKSKQSRGDMADAYFGNVSGKKDSAESDFSL